LLKLWQKADFKQEALCVAQLLHGLQLSFEEGVFEGECLGELKPGAPGGNAQAQSQAGKQQQQIGPCALAKKQREAAA
jgi:hypothetical protein